MSDNETAPAVTDRSSDKTETVNLLASLSYQDKDRILGNLLWDVFGEVNNDGNEVLLPTRGPDGVDVLSLVTSLRQEFWPGLFPDGDSKADTREFPEKAKGKKDKKGKKSRTFSAHFLSVLQTSIRSCRYAAADTKDRDTSRKARLRRARRGLKEVAESLANAILVAGQDE